MLLNMQSIVGQVKRNKVRSIYAQRDGVFKKIKNEPSKGYYKKQYNKLLTQIKTMMKEKQENLQMNQ